MADSRIRNLAGTVSTSELEALLDSLYMVMDDVSFTEAERVALTSLLTSVIVTNNTIDYRALTPQGFYNSIMTTTRRGVAQLAADGEVTAKTGSGVINSTHQTLMQSQWIVDWFGQSGIPGIYTSDDINDPRVMGWESSFNQAMSNTQAVRINPDIPAGYRFSRITFQWASAIMIGPTGIEGAGFSDMAHSGSIVWTTLVSGVLYLQLSADGREIAIYSGGTLSEVLTSIHINTVLRPV